MQCVEGLKRKRGQVDSYVLHCTYTTWSSSHFTCTNPSGKGMNLRSRVRSSSNTVLLPCARLTCTSLAFPTLFWIRRAWICSSRRSFWTLPSVYIYCCSNCYHNYVVISLTLSLISSRSPSLRTIGSMCICLSDLCLFRGPTVISILHFFNVNGVLFSSPLPPRCFDYSFSFVRWEVDFSNYSMPAHSASTRSFTMRYFSGTDLVAASFFFCSARAHIAFWAASFHFCATELSETLLVPTPSFVGFHHLDGHPPTISCTFVSDINYDSLC